jgi:uncharacterized protein
MPLLVSLAALEKGRVELSGELSPAELGLETHDPCIEARRPIVYSLSAELIGGEVMVEGRLTTIFDCHCVRCLEPFEYRMELDPWQCVLLLEGEDAAPIVHEAVDLTPQTREDSLLALPQHPVCSPDCRGLPMQRSDSSRPEGPSDETRRVPSAWSILDTLNLDR